MATTAAWTLILLCRLGEASDSPPSVKVQVRQGRPFAEGVYVNGYGPYRFLLDTGTNVNLIESHLAASIGMAAAFQTELKSAAGKALMPGNEGNDVAFGPIHASGQRFLFSELKAVRGLMPDVQGVLGQSFLSAFDYRLDLRGNRLEFGKQDLKGQRFPLRALNGRATLSTSLGDLVLDSGAAELILFRSESNFFEQGYLQTIGGVRRTGRVFSRLIIEGRNIWDGDAVVISGASEPGISGLMPLSLFRTIYVCNSEGYVVLE